LLQARNAILAALALLVLTIVLVSVETLRPSDSGGLARDSFGTRAHGYRALFELLEELDLQVARSVSPPSADLSPQHTVVLLEPDPDLLAFEPRYVHALMDWVATGGRLVVAPHHVSEDQWNRRLPNPADVVTSRDILKLLKISSNLQVRSSTTDHDDEAQVEREQQDSDALEDEGIFRELMREWSTAATPPELVKTSGTGTFEPIASLAENIAVDGKAQRTLHQKDSNGDSDQETEPFLGTLNFVDQYNQQHLLAVEYSHGKGSLVILSDPRVFSNALIARADNSLLAVHLLAPSGRHVVIDEFYHGLAVRGNPLYLLTRAGFASVVLGILLIVGVSTWRAAVFLGPPLADPVRSRRSIREYIDAMGHFFSRGPGHRRFLARQMREGVMSQLCDELNLPPEQLDVGVITAALRRRSPQRSERFRKAVAEVDALLADSHDFAPNRFVPTMQRLMECL